MPLTYILGIQKGGTTSLSDMHRAALRDGRYEACGPHRSLVTGVLNRKESHFLHHLWPKGVSSSEGQRRLFTSLYNVSYCRSRCFLEATPANLAEKAAPSRLHAMMSASESARARFVISLREPVSRDISWYHQVRNDLVTEYAGVPAAQWPLKEMGDWKDFAKPYHHYALDRLRAMQECTSPFGGLSNASLEAYVHCSDWTVGMPAGGIHYGFYWAMLQLWEQYFPPSQLLIMQMEALFSRSALSVQQELFAHLGMGHLVNASGVMPHSNAHEDDGKQRIMSCASINAMGRAYEPWNARLFEDYPRLNATLWRLPKCSLEEAAILG